MNKPIAALLAMAVTVSAWSADQAGAPTSAAAPTQDQVVQEFRKDLAAKRADIMAKGLTLTAAQAAKFWPLYNEFEAEQDAIVEGQIKATEKYAANFANLGDADALDYVNALLTRDKAMNDLRVKWLAKFQTVVPPKVAARAIHIDRRLSQVMQVQVSSQIPLVR